MFVLSGIIFVICAASLFRDTAAATCGAVACTDTQGVCDAAADICWCIAGFHGAACVTPCNAACTTCTGPADTDCVDSTDVCPDTACAATGTCTTYDDATVIGTAVKCMCDTGYAGAICDIACASACTNGGTCVEAEPGTAECACLNTHVGATCQLLCPVCENGGTCVEAASGTAAECSCPSTHVGTLCQYACPTGAAACDGVLKVCAANAGDTAAECVCKPGLSGVNCTIVDCSGDSPCLNGGTCNAATDPDVCTCPTTHTGAICQLDCTPACTGDETCKEEDGAAKCSGAATVVASVALILAAVARCLF